MRIWNELILDYIWDEIIRTLDSSMEASWNDDDDIPTLIVEKRDELGKVELVHFINFIDDSLIYIVSNVDKFSEDNYNLYVELPITEVDMGNDINIENLINLIVYCLDEVDNTKKEVEMFRKTNGRVGFTVTNKEKSADEIEKFALINEGEVKKGIIHPYVL